LNAGTLSYWKWRLSREQPRPSATSAARKHREHKPEFVELAPVALSDDRVEVELSNGHRLRVPARFDSQALTRLIAIVGAAS
jgi:hypothetical protein